MTKRQQKQDGLVADWNARHPIGTRVNYQPVLRDKTYIPGKTISDAWLMGGHTAVVRVEHDATNVVTTASVQHLTPA